MNGTAIDLIADTSAVIGLLRRDSRVEQKVKGKNFAITFVTEAEILLGVLKARFGRLDTPRALEQSRATKVNGFGESAGLNRRRLEIGSWKALHWRLYEHRQTTC